MAKTKSKLGDYRLERVHGLLIYAMSQKMSVVLRRLAEDRSEEVAFGRFINNPKVTPKGIVEHYNHVSATDFEGKHILVIQDGSSTTFGLNTNRGDLGYVGHNTNKSGFNLHPSIYVDAKDGACYGLGSLELWKTSVAKTKAEQAERRKNRSKTPFQDKETYKWYSVSEQAVKNNGSADNYTIVGDRGADIYDLFALYQANNWDFVIRAARDRRLFDVAASDKMSEASMLYATIDTWEVRHTYELDLPKTPKRSAHTAELNLKFGTIDIPKPPSHPDETLPTSLTLQVVEVKELEQTVVGKEKPVHWRIFTTHPVQNVEQAMTIIKWYRWRWGIEQVFRTLKTKGLNIEKSEVESYEALVNLTTLALLAAVQVLQLVQAREGQTQQEVQTVFSEQEVVCLGLLNQKLEGNTMKTKNPHPRKSLAFAVWVIARLGGWKGYKKSRPPGPITLLRGIIRFYDILEGYYLLL